MYQKKPESRQNPTTEQWMNAFRKILSSKHPVTLKTILNKCAYLANPFMARVRYDQWYRMESSKNQPLETKIAMGQRVLVRDRLNQFTRTGRVVCVRQDNITAYKLPPKTKRRRCVKEAKKEEGNGKAS